MDIFLEKHQESILGVIEGFDRIIFKGHLTSMFPDGACRSWGQVFLFSSENHQRGLAICLGLG